MDYALSIVARYNRTSYFYPTFSESSEHSHLLVSPVLVASAVIGVVIILSCITIIVGSIRRDRQARLQRHRHRHRRHHHHHHHHRRRRHREYEQGYVSDGTYSRSSHRIRYSCSPVEDWSPPLDLSSDGDVDVTVLRDLYPDSPPGVTLSRLLWPEKTYTGNFAYRVQPVLSEQTLHTILGRLGYVATSEAEFSLVQAISKEDAEQMVFEIFLARVTCEAILGTSSRQVLGLGREKPYRRRSSKRKLAKAHNCPEGAQPGPQEGLGSERALAEGPDHQSTVPTAPSLSEVSTSPRTLRAGPQLPLDSQRRASTRSDSEEFLTCYSDLVLHRTPLFPRDFPLRGLKGDQAQGPALAPSPPAGEALTSLGSSGEWSLVPSAAPESRVVTNPRQPRLTPGPKLSGKPLDPKPEAQPEPTAPDADTVPPNTSSELDELCEHLSHLLGPPTLADHPGGLPGPGVEDTRQSEPLTGPEPAAEAGGPDSRITQLWRPTQNPLMYGGPRHYVPPGELEGPVLTQEHHPGNS
ncbi:protein BEAN1 [Puma concolor]|uniref:Protein BEAN1 n=1 Tax=Puma concolor TaxID=9696 RepID=A0A6P6HKP5_PUMCO|nr:protein BEAN1 [Puma concolor]